MTISEESTELTQEFKHFEVVAINPEAYDRSTLLTAFKAGNLALGSAFLAGGEEADKALQRFEDPVEAIGLRLAALASSK